MARRKRTLLPQRHARLEIVPMIDVMMFLLVFFVMIALSMIPNAGLSVDLPSAATASTLPTSQLAVALDKTGTLRAEGHLLSLPELVARIGASDAKTTSVVISADRTVDFQHVMAVMDAARGAGVKDIGLATKQD